MQLLFSIFVIIIHFSPGFVLFFVSFCSVISFSHFFAKMFSGSISALASISGRLRFGLSLPVLGSSRVQPGSRVRITPWPQGSIQHLFFSHHLFPTGAGFGGPRHRRKKIQKHRKLGTLLKRLWEWNVRANENTGTPCWNIPVKPRPGSSTLKRSQSGPTTQHDLSRELLASLINIPFKQRQYRP